MDKELENRYAGHISLCEIDLAGQEKLFHAHVLIIGAGGLGSPVALYLAAAGIGHITIADGDTVAISNLQRQIMHATAGIGSLKVESARKAMLAINPNIEITPIPRMLEGEMLRNAISSHDVIVDCTDSRCSRLMVNDACVEAGKPMVFAAVERFSGVVFTHIPGSADYRDFFTEGEEKEETSCAMNGILNTVVGIAGCIQATEVIKLIVGSGDLLTDRILNFDALSMSFTTLGIK